MEISSLKLSTRSLSCHQFSHDLYFAVWWHIIKNLPRKKKYVLFGIYSFPSLFALGAVSSTLLYQAELSIQLTKHELNASLVSMFNHISMIRMHTNITEYPPLVLLSLIKLLKYYKTESSLCKMSSRGNA